MKFSISTLPFIDSEISEQLLTRLKEHNIKSLEVFAQKPHCDILQKRCKRLLEYVENVLKISINSIHLPIYFNRVKDPRERRKISLSTSDNNIRLNSLREIERHILVAGDLGVPVAVLHADIERDDSQEINYLLESLIYLDNVAKKSGVLIALENYTTKYVTVKLLIELISKVDSDSLGICLDVGHSNIFSNYISDLNEARRFLFALHLHDNNGEEDEHLLPYEGVVDFDYIIGFLRTSKFQGVVTLELSGEGITSEWGLERFLKTASFYISSFENPRVTYNIMEPT